MMLLVQALAVGRRVLRHAEALGEDMLREGTAPEGLKRPVSDTTLDRVLGSVEPAGVEQEVHQVVRRGLELGLIRQEFFARGVVTFDGKAGESTLGQAPCEPSHTTKDEQGREYWYPYALRASLTSSAAHPVLDQKLLEGKQGEATAFPELFRRVVEKFGGHFEYVTVDAGMTSAANARVVREAGKHYLMALKENFHRLHDKAWVALAVAPVKVRVRERTSGEWVERELRGGGQAARGGLSRRPAMGMGAADANQRRRAAEGGDAAVPHLHSHRATVPGADADAGTPAPGD